VGQWSSESARASSDEKLVALFACKTKQNLNQVRGKFENAHVLVSDDGTYGHDDRKVNQSLFEGIAKRSSYEEMHNGLRGEKLWEGAENYMLPHDSR
jgi:hypothetical protein